MALVSREFFGLVVLNGLAMGGAQCHVRVSYMHVHPDRDWDIGSGPQKLSVEERPIAVEELEVRAGYTSMYTSMYTRTRRRSSPAGVSVWF